MCSHLHIHTLSQKGLENPSSRYPQEEIHPGIMLPHLALASLPGSMHRDLAGWPYKKVLYQAISFNEKKVSSPNA